MPLRLDIPPDDYDAGPFQKIWRKVELWAGVEENAIRLIKSQLPTFTGAENGIVHINAGGTALTTTTGFTFDGTTFAIGTNKFTVVAASGNTLVAGTLGVVGETTLGVVTADAVANHPLVLKIGTVSSGNGANFRGKTTASITVAKTILTLSTRSALVLVAGNDGTNFFSDLLMVSFGGAAAVVSSNTDTGAPAVRTYSKSGNELQLAMASGTYGTNVMSIELDPK